MAQILEKQPQYDWHQEPSQQQQQQLNDITAAAAEFASRKYENVPAGQQPPAFGARVDDVRFEPARPRRTSSAKRKTQGYWQEFLLWLRTKLLRISSR